MPKLLLRGIRCVQHEPVLGRRVDVAIDLRGTCALGLVCMGYRGGVVT